MASMLLPFTSLQKMAFGSVSVEADARIGRGQKNQISQVLANSTDQPSHVALAADFSTA